MGRRRSGATGIVETPGRVARAFEEFFAGYGQDPALILEKTFEEIEGYDEMIVLRGIRFESHCEHHMAPITGKAWVAYVPRRQPLTCPVPLAEKRARIVGKASLNSHSQNRREV